MGSSTGLRIEPARQAEFSSDDIVVYDDFLAREAQLDVHNFLKLPGWAFGAFSDPSKTASRYWYKHFAGYVKDGAEARTPHEIEAELALNAPVIAGVWRNLKTNVTAGHDLTRCYANGYPHGSEGGLHLDSNIPTHFTLIYYPHFEWHPNYAGETLFFDASGAEIIRAIYPRPNRLVVFPGVIPHVARGVSRTCPELRVTLMFKTAAP